MADDTLEGVKPYDGPAGGWGALKAVAQAIAKGSAAAYYPKANCLVTLHPAA